MRLLINQVLHYLPRSKASDCTERVSLCLDVTLRRDDGEVIPEKHPRYRRDCDGGGGGHRRPDRFS